MILIVGATGRLGSAVAAELLAKGQQIRPAYRTPDRASDAILRHPQAVRFDLRSANTPGELFTGVDSVFVAVHGLSASQKDATQRVDVEGHIRLIDAAAQAGVRRFVYVSAMGASGDHPVPFWRAKAEVERHLKASTLAYTILKPSSFMDFHAHELIGVSVLAGKPVRILGRGEMRRNFVAVADVATIAARALTTDDLAWQTIDVGGPDNLTDREVAAVYGRISNRPVKISALPAGALPVIAALIGPFHAGAARIVRLPLQLPGTPNLEFDASAMPALLGRAPMSLEQFVRDKIRGGGG